MIKDTLIGLLMESFILVSFGYFIRKFYFHPEDIQDEIENSIVGQWFNASRNREKNIKTFKRRAIVLMLLSLFLLVMLIKDLTVLLRLVLR